MEVIVFLKFYRFILLICVVSIYFWPDSIQAIDSPQLQASNSPVLVDDQLLWPQANSIIQAERNGANAQILLTRQVPILGLSATQTHLAWLEHNINTTLLVYDRARQTIILQHEYPYSPQMRIALDQNVVWFSGIMGQAGLFRWAIGQDTAQLVSASGQDPIAQAGVLVWVEQQAQSQQLWARFGQQTLLLTEQVGNEYIFASYHTNGQQVAWTLEASFGVPNIYLFDLATRTVQQYPAELGAQVYVAQDRLVWAGFSQQRQWQVALIENNTPSVVLYSGATRPLIHAADQDGLVISLETSRAQTPYDLVLLDWQSQLHRRSERQTQAITCIPASTCGQLRVQGAALADAQGVSQIKGVQFFLPQYGINDRSLRTANYAVAQQDGSLDFWLDKSSRYLHANLLRIFVELPYQSNGNIITPTDYATLYDFAQRANQRGMRLGISLHNSANWTMQPEQAAWIRGMLSYFTERNALASIAYLSADNEINNHCSRQGIDCFDSTAAYNAQAYIDGAISWVGAVRQVVKSHTPSMLITVGISTEMQDADGTRGAFNFFRSATNNTSLASLVDFVSPHNYGGGAAGILSDIRYAGYQGPVLLEEFGFPTDPLTQNSLWNEGPNLCRTQPLHTSCHNTAPYYIEQNILALQSHNYAGGVAWMLSDVQEKNGSSACNSRPSDLWTGLFSIGGSYCGGTSSQQYGEAKATAIRVCIYYSSARGLCNSDLILRERLYLPNVFR
jgi:hypothetical protein